jgi:hypothetical protein
MKRKGLGETWLVWTEEDRRGSDSMYTRKNSINVYCLSIHLLGIIRMEREDVERAGVEGLMGGNELPVLSLKWSLKRGNYEAEELWKQGRSTVDS